MYNYKRLILCSFKDFSAENISFKIERIERFQKSMAWESPKLRSTTFRPKIFRLKSRESRDSKKSSAWESQKERIGHFSAENISFKT
jgi:hypothetical protein